MRRPVWLTALLAVALLAAVVEAPAQQPGVPDGFTVYQLLGPGVGAPPVPFRIEGDRITTPPGGMISVVESRLDDGRLDMTLDLPGGTGRYLARRHGNAFAGYMMLFIGETRDLVPLSMVPVGGDEGLRPDPTAFSTAPGISRIEVLPDDARLEAGERRRFVARVWDEDGREIPDAEVEWFGAGSRVRVTGDGEFRSMSAGTKRIAAFVDGAIGFAEVRIAEPRIGSIVLFTELPSRLAVGSRVPLDYDALDTVNRWVLDPAIEIVSSDPRVVGVEGSTLIAGSPGTATVVLSADDARIERAIEVVPAPGELEITGAPSDPVRTGEVVRLSTTVDHAAPVWTVDSDDAQVFPDGAFVAKGPGLHTVVATLGGRAATTTIHALPREVDGRIRIQGHGPNAETHTSDLWPQNGYVYVGTHQANRLLTWDVAHPSAPIRTDVQEFDARVVNDVKVNEAGTLLVATREGASDRRNGILVFSLEDPETPRLVSEYTETLTAGVHNVFWSGDLLYAVNDGTGDLHVVDLSDPTRPREVGRWGLPVAGRALHDVWVQDGIGYLSYLWDGLAIVDVGGAGKGGTPTAPVLVSRIFYPGGPTHTAMRHGDYLFVGDENFSTFGTVPSSVGSDPRGPVHVIDVSDLERPRVVARYEVPEAGAHNLWIDDDTLYVAYYQGGIRVVDVSGELRGDLYAQGRQIAHFLPQAGPDEAKRPFSPRVWGVFPMFENGWEPVGETLYATDYNSGLWTFTVERPEPEEPIS
ncbi:MAG: hypothetical protein R3326_06200 [Gemmatimonadota bacterium]|nr:hypothetical protein [Gemmatimonadota bacterium]